MAVAKCLDQEIGALLRKNAITHPLSQIRGYATAHNPRIGWHQCHDYRIAKFGRNLGTGILSYDKITWPTVTALSSMLIVDEQDLSKHARSTMDTVCFNCSSWWHL